MTRPIRVLQVVQSLNYGGMERVIAELTKRTDPSQFEMHIMALEYLGHFSEGLEPFATLHLARPMPRISMLRPTGLAAQIQEIAPDIVHTHSGVWYKTSLAACMARVPRVMHTDHGRQNPDPALYKFLDRRASRRTDVVVAVSDALAQQLRKIASDPSIVTVIRNGVDTDRYHPAPLDTTLHAELGVDPSTPMIGSVGRLEAIKGYEVAIQAFAKLLDRWTSTPRPILVLIGDGSQNEALQRLAGELGVTDSVYFLGWRSDIEQCLHAFSIFTMSSHSEGTSVSLLEAMSSGLCPVVTNVGGNAAALGKALQHGLVERGNSDALATTWYDVLQNPTRRTQDAEAARTQVLHEFGLDAMVRQYEALYLSLHTGAHRSTPRQPAALAS